MITMHNNLSSTKRNYVLDDAVQEIIIIFCRLLMVFCYFFFGYIIICEHFFERIP